MTMLGDERQPLLRSSNDDLQPQPQPNDNLPEHWSPAYRWSIVGLLAFQAFTVAFACISVVPVASQIVSDLNNGHTNKSNSILLVTIWELGEAAGPLIIAPLSEIYGRYPIFNVANSLFICGIAISAFSRNVGLFVFARFLTGCAVASGVLNPAVIGDIFPPEQRGSAMSVVMLAPLLGGAVGPAIAGMIAQTLGWREIMVMALGLSVVCEVAFLTLFRETYKIVILKREKRLEAEVEEEESVKRAVLEAESALWASIVRPASVLADSFVLKIMALYGALIFSFFYIVSTTLPDILLSVYEFPISLVGTAFLSFSFGSFFGVVVCNRLLDRIYKRRQKPGSNTSAPENRLPLMIIGAFIFPFIIALYGWIAHFKLPVLVLLFSVALIGFFMLVTVLPLMSYIVDAFPLYSASAMTTILISRCLVSTFLPLVTAPLTDAIGWGWGFMVLAGACLLLAPIPALLLRYGAVWRSSSKYTRDA